MATTDVPGLADIQAWAQFLGIDIADHVAKAQMLMQTDPAAVRAAGEHLTTVASGLDIDHRGLRLAGSDVLAGWSGEAAKAFDPHLAGLANHVADTKDASTRFATNLDTVATGFEQSQHIVSTITGAAATQLRMLQV